MVPVIVLSDEPVQNGCNAATIALQGFEQFPYTVLYRPEIKLDPSASPCGLGPVLAGKFIAKEAATRVTDAVIAGITRRQDALAALPPAPTDGSPDPDAEQRAALPVQIQQLQQLLATATPDIIPRIDDFYTDFLKVCAPNLVTQYTHEWEQTKARFQTPPTLPPTL